LNLGELTCATSSHSTATTVPKEILSAVYRICLL